MFKCLKQLLLLIATNKPWKSWKCVYFPPRVWVLIQLQPAASYVCQLIKPCLFHWALPPPNDCCSWRFSYLKRGHTHNRWSSAHTLRVWNESQGRKDEYATSFFLFTCLKLWFNDSFFRKIKVIFFNSDLHTRCFYSIVWRAWAKICRELFLLLSVYNCFIYTSTSQSTGHMTLCNVKILIFRLCVVLEVVGTRVKPDWRRRGRPLWIPRWGNLQQPTVWLGQMNL